MRTRWIWDGKKPTLRAELSITNLTSNMRELINCVIEFGTLAYLEIIAQFYWILKLQNDRKLLCQKQQQVENPMTCARNVYRMNSGDTTMVWKFEKRSSSSHRKE